MFKDEKEFEKIVNRLNINTEPNSAHRENLRQEILSDFNDTKQQSQKQSELTDCSPGYRIYGSFVIL